MHDPARLSAPAPLEADRPELPAPSLDALPLWRLAIAVCAMTALLLPASPGFFGHVDADILLSTEVSLLRWTPYCWGQHRFGMLLPLLAMPVRDPVANLLLQTALSTFAALFSLVLGARLLFGRREALFAALVAILAALVVLPSPSSSTSPRCTRTDRRSLWGSAGCCCWSVRGGGPCCSAACWCWWRTG